ncbi:MAG: murein transglycosylase [Alphaproteobacteria bacterium]|nr:murein transglycosylase [Alphaproteobacteria bacterium]
MRSFPRLRGLLLAATLSFTASQGAFAAGMELHRTDFSQVPDWGIDQHGYALESLQRSCYKFHSQPVETPYGEGKLKGKVGDWNLICRDVLEMNPSDNLGSRRLFERHFTPFAVSFDGNYEGKLTGYYEPLLMASFTKKPGYEVPVYAPPADLPKDGSVYPLTRKQINAGALKGKGLEKLYVSSAIDLFFLQVQGSGRALVDETGQRLNLKFAGKTNQPYTAIGKILVERGELTKEEVSAPAIRQWLKTHPDQAQALMEENASYVFFTVEPNTGEGGATGAQNTVLLPERSMAVDTRFIPLGLPVFVNTTLPNSKHGQGAVYSHLLIAQDKGSAILGAVRGDIFFGHGDRAEDLAGHMNSAGKFFVLVPNTIAERIP